MKKKMEKGQAITEFVICMMGILFVFLGLLATSILAMENVRCVIDSRSEIDGDSAMGTTVGGGSKSPKPILEWSNGNDGIPFTGDDEPSGSMAFYPYIDLFNTQNHTLTSSGTEDSSPLVIHPLSLYQTGERGYTDSDRVNMTFLGAASLSGSTVTVSDPLSKRGLPELQQLLRWLSGNGSYSIEDTVFMPSRTE